MTITWETPLDEKTFDIIQNLFNIFYSKKKGVFVDHEEKNTYFVIYTHNYHVLKIITINNQKLSEFVDPNRWW